MLSNQLIILDASTDLKKEYRNLDSVCYVSDVYMMLSSTKRYWSWSYYIEIEDKDGAPIDLKEKHMVGKFNNRTFLRFVSGMVGSKNYPRISEKKEVFLTNEGKKNENNQLLAAIVKGDAEKDKKARSKGYVKFGEKIGPPTFEIINNNVLKVPVPEQFVSKFDNKFDEKVYAQIKRDGVSLVCCYHPDFKDQKYNVISYTRKRKLAVGFNDIKKELANVLKDYPGLFVIGELYKHGMKHENINSIHSKNIQGSLLKAGIPYYIFDCFYTEMSDKGKRTLNLEGIEEVVDKYNYIVDFENKRKLDYELSLDESIKHIEYMTDVLENVVNSKNELLTFIEEFTPIDLKFTQRQDILKSIIPERSNILKHVHTFDVKNKEELDYLRANALTDEGVEYEGFILRHNTQYKYSFGSEKRNTSSFKDKEFEDDEFKIIDYDTGEGDAEKMIRFRMTTLGSDIIKRENVTPGEFTTVMNINAEESEELFNDIEKNFKKKYLGKLITVRYQGLTKKGLPRFPRGLRFRDL